MKRWVFTGLLLGSALTAFAQVGELALSMGAALLRNENLGSAVGATDTGAAATFNANAKADFRFALRFTVNNKKFFGHEGGYAYNHANLAFDTTPAQEVGMPIHQGFYNFLAYATPEGSKVRPFAAGGGHFSTFYPPGASVFSGNGVTKFGLNYGGGIKVKVSEVWLIRMDVRDYFQGKPDLGLQNVKGWLHLWEASAGLGFTF